MTGAHEHPEFAELLARVDELAGRLTALEATAQAAQPSVEPAEQSLPFGFGARFRLPPGIPQVVVRDANSLRDALRDGNVVIEIPEGTRLEYGNTPRVGPNVRIWSAGRGAMLKAKGRSACLDIRGDNVLVQNLTVEGGEDESHGKQVLVGPVDNYWLDHLTFRGAADDGLELWAWPDRADAAGDGLISYCRFTADAGFKHTKAMIIGGRERDGRCAARTRVTIYRTTFDVYQRAPLVGDGGYVHVLECAWMGWGIHALKTRRGGMALAEHSCFHYDGGDHADKSISGWGEPDHAVRAESVMYLGGAQLHQPNPHLVPDPPYRYTVADKGYEWILEHAGAGAPEPK